MLQHTETRSKKLCFLTLFYHSLPGHRSLFIVLTFVSLGSLLYIACTILRLHLDPSDSTPGWPRLRARHILALRVSADGGCSEFSSSSSSSTSSGTNISGTPTESVPTKAASAFSSSAPASESIESTHSAVQEADIQRQKLGKEVHFIIGSLSDQLRKTLCMHSKIECISQSSILKLATTAINIVAKHRTRRVSELLIYSCLCFQGRTVSQIVWRGTISLHWPI